MKLSREEKPLEEEHTECSREGDDARNDEITNPPLVNGSLVERRESRPGGMPFLFASVAFRDLTRHDAPEKRTKPPAKVPKHQQHLNNN